MFHDNLTSTFRNESEHFDDLMVALEDRRFQHKNELGSYSGEQSLLVHYSLQIYVDGYDVYASLIV